MKIAYTPIHLFLAIVLLTSTGGIWAQNKDEWFEGTAASGEMVRVPIKSMKALKYPRRAERLGAEGYVVVSFDVDETGTMVDLRVTDSKPKILFDKSALKFFKNMRLSPAMIDGKEVYASDITFRLRFELGR